jgi:hypothetical protein
MSERYKGKLYHQTEWGTTVALTCHFKFQYATNAMKYDPEMADGKRPVCNGCGPCGYGALVPDTILGVPATICGDLHNWGYQFGTDHEDKAIIDETFGDNMDRLIRDAYENECRKIKGGSLVTIRLWLAKRRYMARLTMAEDVYEKAVKVFGKSAFWEKRQIRFSLDDIKED